MCVIWTGGCHLLGGLMDLELAYGLDLLLDYPGLNYWLFFPCICILRIAGLMSPLSYSTKFLCFFPESITRKNLSKVTFL